MYWTEWIKTKFYFLTFCVRSHWKLHSLRPAEMIDQQYPEKPSPEARQSWLGPVSLCWPVQNTRLNWLKGFNKYRPSRLLLDWIREVLLYKLQSCSERQSNVLVQISTFYNPLYGNYISAAYIFLSQKYQIGKRYLYVS